MREYAVNVKNYGAKGDGEHDDREAIQNAVTAAGGESSAVGSVFFPPGTYCMSKGAGYYCIDLPSNVMLAGAGRDVSVLKVGNNQPNWTRAIRISNKTNIRITNLTIDGNYENNSAEYVQMHGVHAENAGYVTV